MTDNIQQLDSDDGLNVVQIDGTVIEPMLPAFDKINTNFETVLTDTTADATAKADAAEAAAKAYADGIVATETSARDSADTTLQNNIDAEIARATSIESGLRTDVDAVTGRVDIIIGSSPESLDTIQEIVTAFEDADSDLQQVITNNSSRLTTAESDIDAVEVRATDLESRATTVEGTVSSVQGEVNTLQSEMNAVDGRATSLETDVTSLEVRTTDLETTVTQNQSKIGTGSFNTTAQDNVGAVNEVHGELDAAVTRVDGHDTVVADLQTQITSEVTRATAQESTILSELAASSGVLDNQNSSGNPIKLWTGTQIQYSALTPDPDTLYFITG